MLVSMGGRRVRSKGVHYQEVKAAVPIQCSCKNNANGLQQLEWSVVCAVCSDKSIVCHLEYLYVVASGVNTLTVLLPWELGGAARLISAGVLWPKTTVSFAACCMTCVSRDQAAAAMLYARVVAEAAVLLLRLRQHHHVVAGSCATLS